MFRLPASSNRVTSTRSTPFIKRSLLAPSKPCIRFERVEFSVSKAKEEVVKRSPSLKKAVEKPAIHDFPLNHSTKLLEAISAVCAFGVDLENIHEFTTIGMQSSGKSSLITAIIGETILPSQMGQATLKKTKIFTIRAPQRRFKIGTKIFTSALEAKEEVERLNANSSVNEITLTVYGPELCNVILTDTPGLYSIDHNDKELPKRISKLVKETLHHANSIPLVVVNGGTDFATDKGLSFVLGSEKAKDALGVITKVDMVDPSTLKSIEKVVQGKAYQLGHGYIPVILRSHEDLQNGLTVGTKIAEETKFFNDHPMLRPAGVPELRRAISHILFEKIKGKLPRLLEDIDAKIEKLQQSMGLLDSLVNDPNKELPKRLGGVLEKLFDGSPDRAIFEKKLRDEFHSVIHAYLLTTFPKDSQAEEELKFAMHPMGFEIESFLNDEKVNPTLFTYDKFKELFEYGQTSPIVINNATVGNAFRSEVLLATCSHVVAPYVDDDLGFKKATWIKEWKKYFSGLLDKDTIQNMVYEITERNVIAYINEESGSNNEMSRQFAEYLAKEVGHEVYEDKIKASIGFAINTLKRPNISTHELVREFSKMYPQHFTFERGFLNSLFHRNQVISVELYGQTFKMAYFRALSTIIADVCYKNVAVNLLDLFVIKLIEKFIDMLKKDNAIKAKQNVDQKVEQLKNLRTTIAQYIE